MKIQTGKGNSGFTIIELMIVVIIISILVALAYPSYIKYVRKSKRGDAQQLLMNWSINQEIWRSNNPTYNNITTAGTDGYMIPSADDYNFSLVGTPDATTYMLQARFKAGNDQENVTARDSTIPCNTLTMDQNGVKLPAACWE